MAPKRGVYVEHAAVCVMDTTGSYRARHLALSTCLAQASKGGPYPELCDLLTELCCPKPAPRPPAGALAAIPIGPPRLRQPHE